MSDRDPLHRQILERLGGEINPQTFEDAVCDLLRDSFPSLVPIRGGSDAGRDGAIADGEGDAFPLVCTVGQDVLGNLTQSLDSYMRNGGPRRKVVMATSQALTPQRRLNLEKQAVELGFTLVQVIEQRGIADRLYRDARWLRELLGLSGTPSALSAVPLSRRPFLDLLPVGRDEDLAWLRTAAGDRVLSGQPGSGKTFLLQHLIREGWPGLFLASRDETEIANALRAQDPGFVVIVDDAHADLDMPVRLRRLREEIGAKFDILATTWPGNLDSVLEALGSTAAVRQLEFLTRPEILEVYRQAGITEANTDSGLLRELVNQASTRPGLAATLALLWLRGAWRDVLTGRALSRHVRETFRLLVGTDAAPLLAAFALGGDRGMALTTVAELLGLSLADAWRQTADLAAGGALVAIEPEVLAVRPHQLRSALIWTVFFPDPGRGPALPYRSFIERASSLGSAVAALVQARIDGVPVLDAELHEWVSRADALDPWRKMTEEQPELREFILHSDVFAAWQGLTLSSEENARWALDHYPGETLHLASEALISAPHAIIPLLFARAPDYPASLHSREDHPLRILSRWTRKPLKGPEESLRRRRLLINEIAKYLRESGSSAVGLRALSVALSPKLETHSLDPGIGNVVTFSWGVLPESGLREFGSLWAAVRGELGSLPPESWPALATVFWEWTHPEHLMLDGRISDRIIRILHDLAATVIQDLVPMVSESPGLSSELRQFVARLGLTVDLPGDPVFELLFPPPGRETVSKPDQVAILELASTWSEDSAHAVAQHLAYYEREARNIEHYWPRHTPLVCGELAARVQNPTTWLKAFFEEDLPGDLAEPFLHEILKRRPKGWDRLLEKWLDTDAWRGTVAALLAAVADLPTRLEEQLIATLESRPQLTYGLALRDELCPRLLKALFLSNQAESALAAAVGLWTAREEIPTDLVADWRQAILRADGKTEDRSLESSLARVLADDPDLAFHWLRNRIESASVPLEALLFGESLSTALSVLDIEQRKRLLAELVPTPVVSELLPRLVGKNPALFRELLARTDLREHHLAPLRGLPDAEWIPLALAASEAGWENRDIAGNTVSDPLHSYSGTGLEYWLRWQKSFAALEADPHPEIRAIGSAGQDLVEPLIERAREKEKQIARDGF